MKVKEILKQCCELLVKVTILPIYCLFNITGPQPIIDKFGLMAIFHFKWAGVFLHFPSLTSLMKITALKMVKIV